MFYRLFHAPPPERHAQGADGRAAPGTGETSILMAFATAMGPDMPVVLREGDGDVVITCGRAAAKARPCIVMVEEMPSPIRG
jgi:hypothetical protein